MMEISDNNNDDEKQKYRKKKAKLRRLRRLKKTKSEKPDELPVQRNPYHLYPKFYFDTGDKRKIQYLPPMVTVKHKKKALKKFDSEKRLHSDDGPAVVFVSKKGTAATPCRYEEYYYHGLLHRDDGPARTYQMTQSAVFNEYYYKGKLHRDEGLPAIDYPNGTREWWVHGLRHRDEDNPAVILTTGHREWWVNGQLHRLKYPAIIYNDGTLEYWLHGKQVTQNDV